MAHMPMDVYTKTVNGNYTTNTSVFTAIYLVEVAKKGLDGKETRDEKVAKNEVTVGKTTAKKETKKTETKKVEKKEEKKETKKTTTKKVDYSAMKVDELKKIAEKKKIDVKGLKKAEIIAALEK